MVPDTANAALRTYPPRRSLVIKRGPGNGFGYAMRSSILFSAVLLAGCVASGGVPLLERGLVEVPTAVAGVLETDGRCYRLRLTDRTATIVWVEGTRFGTDRRGRFVTDIAGQKRYAGDRVGLSGGSLSAERLRENPRFSQYLSDCGQDLITGLRFTPTVPKSQANKRSPHRGELVGSRFQPDLLKQGDNWRREQEDPLTRPEAIRRLVVKGLRS